MKFESKIDVAKEKINDAIEKALNEIGTFIVAEAQVRTPVDTGTLRRGESFKVDVSNKAVYVGSNVEYDQYVEMGTSKQEAQPHWQPAVNENIDDINKIIKKHLQEVGDN